MSTENITTENARALLNLQIATLEISALPCLHAAKELTALHLRVAKEAVAETSEAFAAALFRGEWEPLARVVKQSGNVQSPRVNSYALSLGQIAGAANTQILINAGWSGVGMQVDAVTAAKKIMLPSLQT